jgi:hypothetical protein
MHLMPLTAIALAAALQLHPAALTGRVLDPTGRAVPGATIHVAAADVALSAVSDRAGRFRIGSLSEGPYQLTVSLAGFRTQRLPVHVDSTIAPEVVVSLAPGILSEVLWVVPPPGDAYRRAAAIAHLRIGATDDRRPCGDAHVVTTRHEASTLRVFKGSLPTRFRLYQEAAGRCSEAGRWHEGIERPYREGEEYVVFLVEHPDGFGRLAGPSLAFAVREGMVDLAGSDNGLSLDEFGELLERFARDSPQTPASVAAR